MLNVNNLLFHGNVSSSYQQCSSSATDGEKGLFPLFTFLVATYVASIIRLALFLCLPKFDSGMFPFGFFGASFGHLVLLTRMGRIAVWNIRETSRSKIVFLVLDALL
jgi:hypothetical protein